MAPQKPTPEEKLFAVMQGLQHPSPRARAQTLSLTLVSTQLKALTAAIDLPRVNQALTVAAILLGVWCVVSPLVMWPRLDRLLAKVQQHAAPFIIAPPLEGLRAREDYLQAMQQQDPFRVGELPLLPTPVSAPVQPPPAAPDAQAQLAKLHLVGIARDKEPVAMIEEQGVLQTHVLKTGDAIGVFTVKAILKDRVVLQYGSQELELF